MFSTQIVSFCSINPVTCGKHYLQLRSRKQHVTAPVLFGIMQDIVAINKNILVLYLASLISYVQAKQFGLSMLSQASCFDRGFEAEFCSSNSSRNSNLRNGISMTQYAPERTPVKYYSPKTFLILPKQFGGFSFLPRQRVWQSLGKNKFLLCAVTAATKNPLSEKDSAFSVYT